MSYQPLWLRDLVAYSIQAAVLVGVGVVMARVLGLRAPRVRLAYWQVLLTLCVFLPLLQPWQPEVLKSSGAALSRITFVTPAATAAPSGPLLAEIVLWLICAGVVLRIVWMAMGLGRLWLYRRHADRIEQTPEAIGQAQRLAPVSPAFFISRQIPTPATFGFFRPAILFPARFLKMEPAMQKAVALHELLHVERRDWLWNVFEEIVLTLLWFHLPLWWVVRSARLSREQVVDAEAVRRSNARRPYLKALLEMAGQKRLAESLPAPLFLREGQLAERVALMMKEVHMSRTRLTVSLLTATVTLLIAGTALVWAFPLKSPAPQAEAPTIASGPAYSEARNSAAGAVVPGKEVTAESGPGQKIGRVYKVGGKVSAPTPIYKPEPPYTPQAKKVHLEGIVVLWAVVDAKGNVVEAKEQSKPLGQGLDESALKTVRTWKFKPAIRKGVAVPVKVMIEVSFRGDWNNKDQVSQNPGPADDPPAQSTRNVSADANKNHKAYVNQKEIQRQLEEAMQQAKIAQQATAKIDQKKIQQQVAQAMKKAKIAQKNFSRIDREKIQQLVNEAINQATAAQKAASKIDQAKIQKQMEEAMMQLQKMDTAAMRQKMQQQMERLQEMNTPEMQQKLQEAMKQLQRMNLPEMRRQMQEQMEQLKKMNTPEMKEQLRQALKQAKIAQEAATKLNKAEIQRQLEQARKQIDQARQEEKAARKEAAKARQEAMKARRQKTDQGKEVKPPAAPPAPPMPPVPPSSEKLSPPPPPPASPAPPPSPQN